jgi:16S rRNA A1518/A1519 N6-dimethyltransferase RsmA/KsgA/DIM1 with predicted DNA glycosylase/AP lyase activity
VDVGDRAVFERLVRGVFQQRRKTLLNALRPVAETFARSAADLLERAGVDARIRPGDLPLAGFAALTRAVL